MPEGTRADGEGVFVSAGDLPDRFEENPSEATPAWRRAIERSQWLRAEGERRRN